MANFALSPPESPLIDTDHKQVADLRFEMRMSRPLFKSLEMMSKNEGISKANIVRRSLGLYARAIEAESQGQLIGFGRSKEDGPPEVMELIRINAAQSKGKNLSAGKKIANNETFDRFEMRMSEDLFNRLEQISNEESISKANVVRRALGLYALASEAAAKEQLILFAKINESGAVSVVDAIKLR
jgi:predicted DNA-binding protein